jgi:hypothetical protein
MLSFRTDSLRCRPEAAVAPAAAPAAVAATAAVVPSDVAGAEATGPAGFICNGPGVALAGAPCWESGVE